MKPSTPENRIRTGVRNLDSVLYGGIPAGELAVFAGSPGAGKTTLAHQIIFTNATLEKPALIFQTLSEATAKTLRDLRHFSFFDPRKLENGSVTFIELGEILRARGLEEAINLMMSQIQNVRHAFVVIDSFKVFDDLAWNREELRKFTYEVAVNLMASECPSFFLGEFSAADMETNPLFSIIEGIVTLRIRLEFGEHQRFIQVMKMRGTDHSRDEHAFAITDAGPEVYAHRVTIRRLPNTDRRMPGNGPVRLALGIPDLDRPLGDGIAVGSSLLVSGVAGTGKTLLLLGFIYRGATEFGEKGIFFSFEETRERVIASVRGMGCDLEELLRRGLIEIVFIPQPEIVVEKHLLMMKDAIERTGAKRIAVDSSSVFVHKITDPQTVREMIFQLTTLIQMTQAVGLFSSDIPYGSDRISRFGVEETVADGIILPSAVENAKTLKRNRFLKIYKLRNTAQANGRHRIEIGPGGIAVTGSSLKPRPASGRTRQVRAKGKKPR